VAKWHPIEFIPILSFQSKKMENQLIPDEIIMNKIYYIRGHKTMLASDLAELYNIETRVLNQSVNRNLKRFPLDFMFQLSENEYSSLTSQIVMSKKGRGGRRVLPFVFTECITHFSFSESLSLTFL
jgi:hypothetical protein